MLHVNSKCTQKDFEESVDEELRSRKPLTEQLVGVVRYMKAKNIDLSIETTLIVRNLHALQKFAEKVGFSSLQEALWYR